MGGKCKRLKFFVVQGKGEAGIMVMRNEDVFSIGRGKLLGIKDTAATEVPLQIAEISGIKIKGRSWCGYMYVLLLII